MPSHLISARNCLARYGEPRAPSRSRPCGPTPPWPGLRGDALAAPAPAAPFTRISLRARFLPTRNPLGRKPCLHLPVPHRPRYGLDFSTVRSSCSNSFSFSAVFGPRFPSCRRSDSGGPPSLARKRVHARTRDPPHLAHHSQRVGPARRRTHPSKRLKSFVSSSPDPPFSRNSACNSAAARLPRPFRWALHSFGEAISPPQAARSILLVWIPRHPLPPLSWTPDGLLNYCPEKIGGTYAGRKTLWTAKCIQRAWRGPATAPLFPGRERRGDYGRTGAGAVRNPGA